MRLEAKPNFRALGKRFGKETPRAAARSPRCSSDALRAFERGEPVRHRSTATDPLTPDDLDHRSTRRGDPLVKEDGGRFAAIDPT